MRGEAAEEFSIDKHKNCILRVNPDLIHLQSIVAGIEKSIQTRASV